MLVDCNLPDFGPDGTDRGHERPETSGSTGSVSSNSSSTASSNSGGNAALWNELSRSLQYNNYPGFAQWQGMEYLFQRTYII